MTDPTTHDQSMPPGRHAKLQRLLDALDLDDITDPEWATLRYLAGDEPDTVDRLASLIRRARGRS